MFRLKPTNSSLRSTRHISTAQIRKTKDSPALNFRSLLSALRSENDLIDITQPISPHLEIGALTRRVYETSSPPPLFHNLTTTNTTTTNPTNNLFKILGAPVGLRQDPLTRYGRIALQLNLPSTATPLDILNKLMTAKHSPPLPPTPIPSSTAPGKQNILPAHKTNLTKWPIPTLHPLDGGAYVGTYGFHILRSPDHSWTSWSISRTLVAPIMPGQYIAQVHQQWIDHGAQDTPWALVLDGPPAAAFVGGMPLPSGISEDGYVGALADSPLEVVKCETNDLHVPANAEIVLEGRISATKTVPEGPMAEYHGYAFPDEPVPEPRITVDCVTYRDDPVLPICVAGTAPDETHTLWGAAISAEILDALRGAGLPVRMVWMPFETQCCWVVVSVDVGELGRTGWGTEELSRRVGEVVFGTHAGWEAPKVFVVGDDVDVTDTKQVVWAMATRWRPGADEVVFGDVRGLPMVPYMTRAGRAEVPDPGRGGKTRAPSFPMQLARCGGSQWHGRNGQIAGFGEFQMRFSSASATAFHTPQLSPSHPLDPLFCTSLLTFPAISHPIDHPKMTTRALSPPTSPLPTKRTKATHLPPSARICYDWMIVQGNCHYARDRAIFSTYRPITRRLKHNMFNPHEELEVAGVGTVQMAVVRSLENPFETTVLELHDVLHIPEAVCNGFNPLLYGSSMSCTAEAWTGADVAGCPLWVALPFAGGSRLVLPGNPRGETEIIEGRYYTLSLYVSPEERRELVG
ncbi:UbiD family decarboxylase [Aspergillus ellipticus CBS 707.79]|uniref:Ferulic acid decarboxylase 1 n=1 Tax=Aspergillus ellipticus CBS 707.79 TaxID=1448320 RepID=A0A319DAB5_9EURO|nr:UbiD family decarboxylase [Aspergillus ellipticus CBS 707.79]